jgi:hypothetical protein
VCSLLHRCRRVPSPLLWLNVSAVAGRPLPPARIRPALLPIAPTPLISTRGTFGPIRSDGRWFLCVPHTGLGSASRAWSNTGVDWDGWIY